MSRAVALLSGGLDSTTVLAMALEAADSVTALSFVYGQRHGRELDSARAVAAHYGVEHVVTTLDLGMFDSSLTRWDQDIPTERETGRMADEIPSTYVPARNLIMLSVAAGLCESIGADRIYIGANAVDYSGYPDCRPSFFQAFEEVLRQGTKSGVNGRPISVATPILSWSKAEIVREATRLQAPLHLTWSCYAGGEKACGRCDSCRLRLKGFQEAGVEDPVPYEVWS
ncbi:MAG: 7-cyano-7-deazaguanine synthase QueC [Candidatus Methanomethylophilaceae archaeon]|jgi:7-cyano-7-deazaguanine synthase